MKHPGLSPGALLREEDSNFRPSGYEPDELPLLHPASIMLRGSRAVRIEEASGRSGLQRDPKKNAIHFCTRDGAGALTTAAGVTASCCTPISVSLGSTYP